MQADGREASRTYANYLKYAIQYHPKTHTFELQYAGKGLFAQHVCIADLYNSVGERMGGIRDYPYLTTQWELRNYGSETRLFIRYARTAEAQTPDLTLTFTVDRTGIHCDVESAEGLIPSFTGDLYWGENMAEDTFAVCLDREGFDLRCALGPATSEIDNALFDRTDGTVLELTGSDRLRLGFRWDTGVYSFCATGRRLSFSVQAEVFERRFHTPYKAINKKNTFPVPPVGWMTWYAVKFDACEQAVLDNARFLREHFADFGANVIWVDWEWYHSAFSQHGPEGIHFFAPDPVRYPNGLRHVADEIHRLGQTAALWIGPTNEPAPNDFIRDHKDAVLAKKVAWSGEYFFDLTHPAFLEEYIPAVARQIQEWDYDAVKWDCLPVTILFADQYHEYMLRPEKTSEEALRAAVRILRGCLGDDVYMLSCAGAADRDVVMAIDLFDGARIGGDIFNWREFINDFVARIYRFYSYHNTQIYCDPDNLVIRPEFNSLDQAISRTSFLSVLGLPVTLGDNLPDLPEERLELLRRIMPAMDAHPMDIRESGHDQKTVVTNLSVNRPFEQWNVVNILNLLEEERTVTVDLQKDLHLPKGRYLVYDYWNRTFLGEFDREITVPLCAQASVILSVRAATGRPQLVSTSRHIGQGAIDLIDLKWDGVRGALTGLSRVVKGDAYTLTAWDPGTQTVITRTIHPEETGEYSWCILFEGWKKI